MKTTRVLRQNWLTRKPLEAAEFATAFIASVTALATWMFWNGIANTDKLMPASPHQVFDKHEYWRLWTSLFAHADPGHLVSNGILFIPLCYFLTGYFGPWLFPLIGLAMGGVINIAALQTMGSHESIIGISGLVYWMGAAWLTLYLLIGSRESARRRLGKALFIAAALFAPQTFEPNVSYVAHAFGFVFGVPSALLYFAANKEKFKRAEVWEVVPEEEPDVEFTAEPEDIIATPGLLLAVQNFDRPQEENPTFH